MHDVQLAGLSESMIRVVAAALTKSGSEQLQGWVREVDAEVALASPLLQEGLERWHPLGVRWVMTRLLMLFRSTLSLSASTAAKGIISETF